MRWISLVSHNVIWVCHFGNILNCAKNGGIFWSTISWFLRKKDLEIGATKLKLFFPSISLPFSLLTDCLVLNCVIEIWQKLFFRFIIFSSSKFYSAVVICWRFWTYIDFWSKHKDHGPTLICLFDVDNIKIDENHGVIQLDASILMQSRLQWFFKRIELV